MRQMSLQRRRVVLMASSMAAMSGVGPVLLRGHRFWEMAWLVFIAAWLAVLIWQMVKVRKEAGCSK